MKQILSLLFLITLFTKQISAHELNLTLIGDNHEVIIIQEDNFNHIATITLRNEGGNFIFELNQLSDSNLEYEIDAACFQNTCTLLVYQ